MIYNSNGNNTPYQSGGNAKVQKELKALQEAINLVDANFNNYVDENDKDIVRIDNNIDAIELSISGIGTRLSTAEGKLEGYDTLVETDKVQSQDADFHKVVAGKYVFQNGASITGTNICKLANGSVVYATDGTNSILIDYTDKDAWVAKAKTEANQYFRIYSNGVLTFTQSGGWSIYVLGNDFSTDNFTIPDETPITVKTGVTIGGTLYAALARDYSFDSITVTSATINSATVTLLTAPNATITDLIATNETVADLTVTDEGNINNLVNAKRNIQDEINGMISIDSHPTNVKVYIGIPKFTGTYNLKLTHGINGAVQTLFTATIVWNGKYPVVQYHEYADNEPVDYLYSIVLANDALYFVTQGAGNLYYSYDAMGGALAPTSAEYPNIPYQSDEVITDYITAHHDRTVFFGNGEVSSGVDVLGEVKADIIDLPDSFTAENITINNNLTVGGNANINNLTAGKFETDKLIGKELLINETGTESGTNTYVHVNNSGLTTNVDTLIDATLEVSEKTTTNELEVSEKATINELEPTEKGYYVDHDYWTLDDGTVMTNTGTPITNPIGTEKSRTLLDTPKMLYSNNTLLIIKESKYQAGTKWEINGQTYSYRSGSVPYQRMDYDWFDNSKHIPKQSVSFSRVVVTSTGETLLNNNDIYFKDGTRWIDYNYGDVITNQGMIEVLEGRHSYSGTRTFMYNFTWNKVTLTASGYVEGSASSIAISYVYATHTAYFTPYKDYVQEIDPNHQYVQADEVLTVKGNEKITRDLKVQGFIYQDEYNRAVLPNINANTINNNGGVLTIGDLD